MILIRTKYLENLHTESSLSYYSIAKILFIPGNLDNSNMPFEQLFLMTPYLLFNFLSFVNKCFPCFLCLFSPVLFLLSFPFPLSSSSSSTFYGCLFLFVALHLVILPSSPLWREKKFTTISKHKILWENFQDKHYWTLKRQWYQQKNHDLQIIFIKTNAISLLCLYKIFIFLLGHLFCIFLHVYGEPF